MIRSYPGSFVVQNFRERADGFGQLRFGNRKRGREADDVTILPFGQQNEAALQHGFNGLHGRVSGWPAVGQVQFDASHQTQTAHGDLKFRI
jgi:hypothetical protein